MDMVNPILGLNIQLRIWALAHPQRAFPLGLGQLMWVDQIRVVLLELWLTIRMVAILLEWWLYY